jgi:hypothetical protein
VAESGGPSQPSVQWVAIAKAKARSSPTCWALLFRSRGLVVMLDRKGVARGGKVKGVPWAFPAQQWLTSSIDGSQHSSVEGAMHAAVVR